MTIHKIGSKVTDMKVQLIKSPIVKDGFCIVTCFNFNHGDTSLITKWSWMTRFAYNVNGTKRMFWSND